MGWLDGSWPWWLGALALSVTTLLFLLALKVPMGVSGSFARAVDWRRNREQRKQEAPFIDDQEALMEALVAATRDEFGEQADGLEPAPAPATEPVEAAPLPVRVPLAAHFVFLGALMVGGLVATWLSGNLQLRYDMGETFQRLFGSGWTSWLALAGGGILVGFGTRMAGGCTSGHGLYGSGRLQPASLVATAVFFGCGVLVSLVLAGVS